MQEVVIYIMGAGVARCLSNPGMSRGFSAFSERTRETDARLFVVGIACGSGA